MQNKARLKFYLNQFELSCLCFGAWSWQAREAWHRYRKEKESQINIVYNKDSKEAA